MLVEELKLFLEQVSLTAKAENEAAEAQAQSVVLGRAPLKIYIG